MMLCSSNTLICSAIVAALSGAHKDVATQQCWPDVSYTRKNAGRAHVLDGKSLLGEQVVHGVKSEIVQVSAVPTFFVASDGNASEQDIKSSWKPRQVGHFHDELAARPQHAIDLCGAEKRVEYVLDDRYCGDSVEEIGGQGQGRIQIGLPDIDALGGPRKSCAGLLCTAGDRLRDIQAVDLFELLAAREPEQATVTTSEIKQTLTRPQQLVRRRYAMQLESTQAQERVAEQAARGFALT